VFTAIRTKRLLIRPVQPDDVVALHQRRNDPEVALYQNWALPFPMGRAREIITSIADTDGPEPGEWWMASVVESEIGDVIGDVAVKLTWAGRTAEIGYTFARDSWGRGYAVEAVNAIVDWLFDDIGVTRVIATLHPDNRASAMVLERTGFLFEGETRQSYWVGDDVSDEWVHGMLRSDRDLWAGRSRANPAQVGFVPVTAANHDEVHRLRTHKTQESFVAPMSHSFADALFPEVVDGAPLVPWMRAVLADDEIVGFVMLALSTEHHPEPYLWRLLIDRRHQHRGIGSRVLELIAEECLRNDNRSLLTSWVEGRGSPAPFYLGHGFVPTGRIVDEETEARKSLV
jgi:RimJ/RimL family protein N-acetyltransferase